MALFLLYSLFRTVGVRGSMLISDIIIKKTSQYNKRRLRTTVATSHN